MGSQRRRSGATHDSVTADPSINNTIIIIVGYTSLLLSYNVVCTFFIYRFFYYINISFLSVAGGPMTRTIGCRRRRRESD